MSDDLSTKLAALRIDREPEPPPRQRSYGKWIALIVALLLGFLGWRSVWPKVSEQLNTVEVEFTNIAVISATDSMVALTATGYVAPQRTTNIGAEVAGRIVRTAIVEGQLVKAGDVLFEFDSSDQLAAIAVAESQVAAARSQIRVIESQISDVAAQIERENRLVNADLTGRNSLQDLERSLETLRSEADARQAEVRASATQVEAARTALENYTIFAPFDALVSTKPAEPGTVPGPGQPLVTLIDAGSLMVEADIPEARLRNVTADAPCEVIFDAFPDERFVGHVAGFGPRVDKARATATARIALDPREGMPQLLPDMAVRVRFLKGEAPAEAQPPKMVMPASAIAERAGVKGVFEVTGNRVAFRQVTLGPAMSEGFELVAGPPASARLVNRPDPLLADGQLVKEKENE